MSNCRIGLSEKPTLSQVFTSVLTYSIIADSGLYDNRNRSVLTEVGMCGFSCRSLDGAVAASFTKSFPGVRLGYHVS